MTSSGIFLASLKASNSPLRTASVALGGYSEHSAIEHIRYRYG